MDNYKGFSLFNEVDNEQLKAYNRLNILRNLKGMNKAKVAEEYFGQFNKSDKLRISLVAHMIGAKGEEFVKAEIARNCNG